MPDTWFDQMHPDRIGASGNVANPDDPPNEDGPIGGGSPTDGPIDPPGGELSGGSPTGGGDPWTAGQGELGGPVDGDPLAGPTTGGLVTPPGGELGGPVGPDGLPLGGGSPTGSGTPGNGWWNDPNFGGPPSPYTSKPWDGGAAPTYHGVGPAPTYAGTGPAPTYHAMGGPAPTYTGPGAAPTFTAPTAADMANDPGYQFRMDQGNQALQRSAAAQGNLLSGGTLKALDRYNQDYASGEFGNVYNRALQNFGAQNTTYGNTANAALNQFAGENQTYQNNVNAGLNQFAGENQTFQNNQAAGLNTFGAQNQTYQNNAAAAQSQFNNANTNYQTRYGTYLGENARTLSDWLQNLTAKRNSETDYWNRLSGVSGTGAGLTGTGAGA